MGQMKTKRSHSNLAFWFAMDWATHPHNRIRQWILKFPNPPWRHHLPDCQRWLGEGRIEYEWPKEWELIPESGVNMCLSVRESVRMQITLGVLCIILPVRRIIANCWKYGYFSKPHSGSHDLCAHNLFSPAWYIDSCLYWDVKLVPSP